MFHTFHTYRTKFQGVWESGGGRRELQGRRHVHGSTSWWFVYVRYMLNLSYLSVGSRLLFRSFAPTDPVGFRPCFPIDYVLWRFDACPQGSSWGGPRSVVQCPPLSSQRLKWFAIPEPKHLFRSNSLISRFFEIFFIFHRFHLFRLFFHGVPVNFFCGVLIFYSCAVYIPVTS